ncbi:MAG: serine hydrolase [Vicinamibacterales bacterium]
MSRPFPSDDDIRRLLRDRIVVSRRAIGGVIGVVDSSGPRTIEYGHPAVGAASLVSSDTLFELGCVTKVLTGLVCADMIERGEMGLSDPIAGYLPPHVPGVGRNGVPVTIEHLMTHTAGLPHHAVDVYDPIERVFDLLRSHVPRHDVGTYYEYSTAGFSVLGYVLERRTGSPHASLVRDRICAPLGMKDTAVDVPRESAHRVAAGHDAGLAPIGPLTTPTVTGGYGFHSTAADLLRLLGACIGCTATPLEAAIVRSAAIRRRGAPGFEHVGMAWHISTLNGSDTISHDGNSMGHRAFVGYSRQERRGVVALLNAVAPVGVTDICRHLLNPEHPLLPNDSVLLRAPLDTPRGVAVGPECLDRYAGVYQLTPNCCVTLTRDGDGLYMSNGRDTRQIVPLNEHEFWLPASGFRPGGVIRFERRADGRISMTVPDRGFQRTLVKIDKRFPPVWHGRLAGEDGPGDVQPYVGCYQFDEFVLEVKCAGRALWAGWTCNASPTVGQVMTTGGTGRPHELVHEREHHFFLKSDRWDTAFVFEPGPDGRIAAVTCQMDQLRERGVRMPAMVA